ncbi:hypothetical protein ROZALSC1DRAFT_22150 [Rozella allomycis CSF55]|uniref:F-box domain-containing protein n=1 Tax=Rozella allomycis (strain CSF55) TaxID=988480 RepID=A0A4P9YJ51_ROZAC|nr:hypothetical protein ROZALSC1DRAFT_22150 [Rozella allomycis CSF55]
MLLQLFSSNLYVKAFGNLPVELMANIVKKVEAKTAKEMIKLKSVNRKFKNAVKLEESVHAAEYFRFLLENKEVNEQELDEAMCNRVTRERIFQSNDIDLIVELLINIDYNLFSKKVIFKEMEKFLAPIYVSEMMWFKHNRVAIEATLYHIENNGIESTYQDSVGNDYENVFMFLMKNYPLEPENQFRLSINAIIAQSTKILSYFEKSDIIKYDSPYFIEGETSAITLVEYFYIQNWKKPFNHLLNRLNNKNDALIRVYSLSIQDNNFEFMKFLLKNYNIRVHDDDFFRALSNPNQMLNIFLKYGRNNKITIDILFKDAINSGNSAGLHYILSQGLLEVKGQHVVLALRQTSNNPVTIILNHSPILIPFAISHCIKQDNVSKLQYLIMQLIPTDIQSFDIKWAIENSAINVLTFFVEYKMTTIHDISSIALENSLFHIFPVLIQNIQFKDQILQDIVKREAFPVSVFKLFKNSNNDDFFQRLYEASVNSGKINLACYILNANFYQPDYNSLAIALKANCTVLIEFLIKYMVHKRNVFANLCTLPDLSANKLLNAVNIMEGYGYQFSEKEKMLIDDIIEKYDVQ